MEFLKLAVAIACGYVLGSVMLEVLGLAFDWAGKTVVRLFYAAVGLVVEQRKQVALAAMKARDEEQRKIVKE